MLRVLIVDDEPHIVQGLKALIDWKSEGFEIAGSASNGQEALDFLRENSVDLIIADIKMPIMSGLELLQNIRENDVTDASFVISSGYADFAFAQTAIKYDCKRYILKPVDKNVLLEILREVKAEHAKETTDTAISREMEDAFYERDLIAVIKGKYDDVNLRGVTKRLGSAENVRYIEIQARSIESEDDQEQDDVDKRALQRKVYQSLRTFLGDDYVNCVFDPSGHDKIFDVGLVYTSALSERFGISEKEYFDKLKDYINSNVYCRIEMFVGKKVNGIKDISKSYGTACKLRYLSGFKEQKNIYIYDENPGNTGKEGIFILKPSIDAFISSIEENNADKIDETIEKLYEDIKNADLSSDFMDININYIVFQLINLASNQDDDINQEEILRIISEKTVASEFNRGSKEHLKRFALEYAEYLAQLRKNVCKGALGDVEKEIKNNYMNNLTLKYLGDKYFINSAYLGQLFHKKYGCSFKDYLNNYRIEKAVSLLLTTDMKTYEIAEAVGYKDVDYFVNKFITIKGCTPVRYRKQN